MNDQVSLAQQLQSGDEGPIILINVFTVDPTDEAALIAAWDHDAGFMKAQPGYISTQLHKGIAGSATLVNYAVWESVESFRNAFTHPEVQSRDAKHPESGVVSPHLFNKLALTGHCVA